MSDRLQNAPVASVVVLAYDSRHRIHWALDSLRRQDFAEPYEVIVVDSGSDGCASHVRAAYPEARPVRSERRLYPGAAWNAGIRTARGHYVALLADDCVAQPDWLRRRVAKHREGFEAVGGAVTNGTPLHPVGTAGYFLEYLPVLPSQTLLERQAIPHTLSCVREVFDRVGLHREDLLTGSDTLLGARVIAAGCAVAVDAQVRIAHKNPTSLRRFLRHQYDHGRGLTRHRAEPAPGIWRPSLPPHLEPRRSAIRRMLVKYPLAKWWSGLGLVARERPRWLPAYLALTPLLWAGLAANVAGQWTEWWRAADGWSLHPRGRAPGTAEADAAISAREGARTPTGAGPPADPT